MQTTQLPLDDTMDLGFFALMAKALMPPWTGHEPLAHPDAAAFRVASPRPGILDRLDTWCWRMEQRAVEAHLSKAQDVYELEARIRDLERGGRYPYY